MLSVIEPVPKPTPVGVGAEGGEEPSGPETGEEPAETDTPTDAE